MENPSLLLASKSPRRRALLAQIGVRFGVLDVDLDETRVPRETPERYVLRLAGETARAARALPESGSGPPVLAADTAVVIGDRILGKPANPSEAAAMMRLLSGRTHRVLSGIALIWEQPGEQVRQALSISEVRFRGVSAREADAYWESGEPCDKAGGYGIQGLGALFVADLRGSYSGVMGLPLFETARLLAEAGIDCLTHPPES